MAKGLLVQTYFEIPTHTAQKLQLGILVSSTESTLSYYYLTFTLNNLWFYSLDWFEFFHQDLHRQIFSLKFDFLKNQLYVQCIISAPLWRKILQCDCAFCCNHWSIFFREHFKCRAAVKISEGWSNIWNSLRICENYLVMCTALLLRISGYSIWSTVFFIRTKSLLELKRWSDGDNAEIRSKSHSSFRA